MPPRPSLHSLLLMAASFAAAATGGDSGLLLAARRRFPVAAAAAAAGGHRIRLLHSFAGGRATRRLEVACCVRSAPGARPAGPVTVRSRNVRMHHGIVLDQHVGGEVLSRVPKVSQAKGDVESETDQEIEANKAATKAVPIWQFHSENTYKAASEEGLGQLFQKLKSEGINPKQWSLGKFQRMMCPKCNGGSNEELSLSVYIRMDGTNATCNCFRSTCGWRGFIQPDRVPKVSQAKGDRERETDQEVEANKAATKAVPIWQFHSENNYKAASEERLGQLVQKLKSEGINPKQWRLGNFQRMMCPKCNGGSTEELSLSVYIRMDGTNATWNCFRSTCGWRGFTQPDRVPKVSQAKGDIERETDQEIEANKAATKAVPIWQFHSENNYKAASEERLGQLVQKLKSEGINPKQWRLGNFQRMMCPKCNGGSNEELSLGFYIRMDGTSATWNCFRSTCGWRGFIQPDRVPKVSQAKGDIESETDQEIEANKAATKAVPIWLFHSENKYKAASEERLGQLFQKLESEGINSKQWRLGKFQRMMCPKCNGGYRKELSLSVFIRMDGMDARWTCFRSTCGWRGFIQPDRVPKVSQAKGDVQSETYQEVEANKAAKKVYRKISEEDLNLEPLCNELVMYFSERRISVETLRRNKVMQRKRKNKISIAFTCRRDGVVVGCKYRAVDKNFSQEANSEKIFYGLDDIVRAEDIIIVEGEIDKLSMDEAGYRNCVSVPSGAPSEISSKIPGKEQDEQYQYLWNCKDYLDLASRIILATDADPPGQVLAEELARRLGKERCWRVKWPKKNETDTCQDANEVLMYLGPQALRKVIEDAELYPIRGLDPSAESSVV